MFVDRQTRAKPGSVLPCCSLCWLMLQLRTQLQVHTDVCCEKVPSPSAGTSIVSLQSYYRLLWYTCPKTMLYVSRTSGTCASYKVMFVDRQTRAKPGSVLPCCSLCWLMLQLRTQLQVHTDVCCEKVPSPSAGTSIVSLQSYYRLLWYICPKTMLYVSRTSGNLRFIQRVSEILMHIAKPEAASYACSL